ncbi:MAG: winged helix-turn-helix transcriptional regulator [Chloroflexi bacterium]|nr:winged helix-turn-helix transcriptional regulator [Chloroflexota bacterium]
MKPELEAEVNQLHADICSALADPNRILILYALADTPHTVNEIAVEAGLSQPATSRHLKVLRERGLVRAARQGVSVEYSLNDPRIIQALDLLRLVLRNSIARRASLLEEKTQPTPQESL